MFYRYLAWAAKATLTLAPLTVGAEEGGSGHYMPGSMASFVDAVPAVPTFIARLNVIGYTGNVDVNKVLPIGGMVATGVDAKVQGYGLTLAWRPRMELPKGWSYAVGATIPLLHVSTTANAAVPVVSKEVSKSDSENGLGDIVFQPVMVNYQVDADFAINGRLSVYAPTGHYGVGRLANTGKNYWTYEPTIALVYFGQKNGIEAAAYVGLSVNTENKDTQYKSGSQFHIDGNVAQHFPTPYGVFSAGLASYYYKQVSADSGVGATLGDFKARTMGIGPSASWITKVGGHDLIAEFKWLHETNVSNRLKGEIYFLKVVTKF